jgi:tetratricopeptide (TPR) repeat protein
MRIFLLIAVAPILFGSAHAKELQDAREHFRVGSAAFQKGEFKRAIVEFKAAYEIAPDAGLLFNMAQAARCANDSEQALSLYKSYLRAQPAASNRQQVERRIAELELSTAAEKVAMAPATVPRGESVELEVKRAPARPRKPMYKRWWPWTLGVLATAGLAVGLGIGLTHYSSDAHFGTRDVLP